MNKLKHFLCKAAIFAAMLAPAIVTTGCTSTIETGNVGVEKSWSGKVSEEAVSPGIYASILTKYYEFSGKEINVTLDNLKPKANDNLSLDDLDVVATYAIDPSVAPKIYTEFKGVSERDDDGVYLPAVGIVKTALEEAALNAVAQHDSLTAHTKRAEIATEIKRLAQAKLDARLPKAFTIKNVSITSLVTDKGIESSIRAKATAQNDLAAMTARLEKAKKDAELNKALNTTYTAEYLQHEKNVAMQKCADNPKCSLVVVDGAFKGSVVLGKQ